jgi:glycine oxidase
VATERIAIVGAGIIGCAVAFELARRGGDVTVFDGREVAGGATQASAGILAPYTEAHGGGPLFDLAVRGLQAYDAFVERVRESSALPFEYRRSGTLEIAEDDDRAGELRARLSAEWAVAAGLQWLDPDALKAQAPAVTHRAVGALRCAAHGHVAVGTFVGAIADAAQKLGAHIHAGTAVSRVELGSSGIDLHVGAKRRTYDRVVLASGAWTPSIDPLGRTAGRIRPVRGQLVRLVSPGIAPAAVVWGRSCYLVPWEDGTLLVGATSEDAGFEERATVEGVRGLLEAAEELMPALGRATFDGVRIGLRPASSDGVPLLGPAEDPRLVYATGHFRNGILLAPLTAALIANYILANARDPVFATT